MDSQFQPPDAVAGTLGGTALVLFINLGFTDILKTCVLAVVGAIVSFGVSLLLHWLIGKGRRKK